MTRRWVTHWRCLTCLQLQHHATTKPKACMRCGGAMVEGPTFGMVDAAELERRARERRRSEHGHSEGVGR